MSTLALFHAMWPTQPGNKAMSYDLPGISKVPQHRICYGAPRNKRRQSSRCCCCPDTSHKGEHFYNSPPMDLHGTVAPSDHSQAHYRSSVEIHCESWICRSRGASLPFLGNCKMNGNSVVKKSRYLLSKYAIHSTTTKLTPMKLSASYDQFQLLAASCTLQHCRIGSR